MILRLQPILALARRDQLEFLRSPRLYVLASLYLLGQGFLFGVAYQAPPTAARTLAGFLAYLWLFFAPALAAGSLASERATGELQALRNDPVSEAELVAAKALTLASLVVPLVASFLLPALASAWLAGTPWSVLATMLLGLELLAVMATSVGILASSVAAQAGSALLLGMALLTLLAGLGLQLGNPTSHDPFWLLDLLHRGILDSRPLILFPLVSLLALYGASQILAGSRRAPLIDPATGSSPGPLRELLHLAGLLLKGAVPPILLFLGVAGLSLRFPVSRDLSGYLGLSPTLAAQLEGLPEPVTIFRPIPPGGLRQDPLADLLDELQRQGAGRIEVEPLDQANFRTRIRPLGLAVPPEEGLVLASRKAVRVLPSADLDVPSRIAEASLARALADLLAPPSRGRLMLADGHGEKPRLAQFPGDPQALSRLTQGLQMVGIASSAIWIQGEAERLGPRDILAVIGPNSPLPPLEVEAIRAHHDRGGPVLVAADPEFPEATRDLLTALGVQFEAGTVVDSHSTLAGAGPSTLLVGASREHPLGRILGDARMVVPSALALKSRNSDRPLLVSGLGARIALGPEDLRDRFRWTTPGPKVLALTREDDRGRLAVLGDSELVTDEILTANPGNQSLITGISCWLVGIPPPAAISLRSLATSVRTSENELQTMTQLIGVLPALGVLGLGLLAWIRWRRRVASGRVPRIPESSQPASV